jgi:hypothetical protein
MSGQVGSIAVGRLYLWEPVPRAKPDGARLFKSDFPAGKFLRRELIPIAGFSAADHPLADSNNDSGLATRDPASERQDVVLDVTGTGAACAPLRRTRMRQLELALDRFRSPMVRARRDTALSRRFSRADRSPGLCYRIGSIKRKEAISRSRNHTPASSVVCRLSLISLSRTD